MATAIDAPTKCDLLSVMLFLQGHSAAYIHPRESEMNVESLFGEVQLYFPIISSIYRIDFECKPI